MGHLAGRSRSHQPRVGFLKIVDEKRLISMRVHLRLYKVYVSVHVITLSLIDTDHQPVFINFRSFGSWSISVLKSVGLVLLDNQNIRILVTANGLFSLRRLSWWEHTCFTRLYEIQLFYIRWFAAGFISLIYLVKKLVVLFRGLRSSQASSRSSNQRYLMVKSAVFRINSNKFFFLIVVNLIKA